MIYINILFYYGIGLQTINHNIYVSDKIVQNLHMMVTQDTVVILVEKLQNL